MSCSGTRLPFFSYHHPVLPRKLLPHPHPPIPKEVITTECIVYTEETRQHDYICRLKMGHCDHQCLRSVLMFCSCYSLPFSTDNIVTLLVVSAILLIAGCGDKHERYTLSYSSNFITLLQQTCISERKCQ
jgi:hypothetical protein